MYFFRPPHARAAPQSYSGVFYYNMDADKVRLIVPLEQCRVQKPMADGKIAMAVTQRRICEWGFGLVGVCVEGHLKPAHNKREYVSQVHPIISPNLPHLPP